MKNPPPTAFADRQRRARGGVFDADDIYKTYEDLKARGVEFKGRQRTGMGNGYGFERQLG